MGSCSLSLSLSLALSQFGGVASLTSLGDDAAPKGAVSSPKSPLGDHLGALQATAATGTATILIRYDIATPVVRYDIIIFAHCSGVKLQKIDKGRILVD